MTMKTRLLALAMAATMVLSACSTAAEPKKEEAPAEPSAPATTPAAPSAPAEAEKPEDKYQIKDLVIGRVSTRELTTFNLLNSPSASVAENLVNMVDSLLEVDTKGKLVPGLAESWGTEDGGKTWTFNIRKGVKWVDVNGNEKGETTAHDWVTAMEWVLNFHKNESSNTAMPIEMIAGAKEYYEYTKAMTLEEAYALDAKEGSKFQEMVGVKAIDDYTLQYDCVAEKPYFDSLATYAALFPMAQGMVDELGIEGVQGMDNTNIWYNGPYLMTEYIQNNEKLFEQNPTYWDTESQRFNSVRVCMIDSLDTGYTLFMNGEIDYIDLTESNLKTIYDDASHEYHENLVELPMQVYSYQILWNYNKHNDDGTPDKNWNTAIANENFRKAFLFGFDQTEWMKRTNLINPLICENNFYTVRGLTYNSDGTDYVDLVNKNLSEPYGEYNGETLIRYNKEKGESYKAKAIEELTALGVTFPVHIRYFIKASDQTALDTANVLKNSIEQSLGEDFVILDIDTYVSSATNEVRVPKLHSIYMLGWAADYNDPMSFIGNELAQYDSASFAKDMRNINDVIDAGATPATEELINDYLTFTDMVWEANDINDDLDKRHEALAKAEAFMVENAICHPAYYKVSWALTKINPYSKMNAKFGSVNEKMKNWETQSEPYTTEQMAEIAAAAK